MKVARGETSPRPVTPPPSVVARTEQSPRRKVKQRERQPQQHKPYLQDVDDQDDDSEEECTASENNSSVPTPSTCATVFAAALLPPAAGPAAGAAASAAGLLPPAAPPRPPAAAAALQAQITAAELTVAADEANDKESVNRAREYKRVTITESEMEHHEKLLPTIDQFEEQIVTLTESKPNSVSRLLSSTKTVHFPDDGDVEIMIYGSQGSDDMQPGKDLTNNKLLILTLFGGLKSKAERAACGDDPAKMKALEEKCQAVNASISPLLIPNVGDDETKVIGTGPMMVSVMTVRGARGSGRPTLLMWNRKDWITYCQNVWPRIRWFLARFGKVSDVKPVDIAIVLDLQKLRSGDQKRAIHPFTEGDDEEWMSKEDYTVMHGFLGSAQTVKIMAQYKGDVTIKLYDQQIQAIGIKQPSTPARLAYVIRRIYVTGEDGEIVCKKTWSKAPPPLLSGEELDGL